MMGSLNNSLARTFAFIMIIAAAFTKFLFVLPVAIFNL
jgi:hypothetical protein